MTEKTTLHIAMFPWFAFGHMNPYLLLSNELAKRGHKISFLIPNKAITQQQDTNRYPNLVTFHPVSIPHVDGLPLGIESASEIPINLDFHLFTAFDNTRPQIENLLSGLKPDLVFYDFAYWIPEVGKQVGFKSVYYHVLCAAILAMYLVPSRKPPFTEDMAVPPPGYPSATMVFRPCEARRRAFFLSKESGSGISFYDRVKSSLCDGDVISIRTCRELEGDVCSYISVKYEKPVLLTGPVLTEHENEPLEDRWAWWLDQFEPNSVVFCSFGSQWVLEKDQFQELVLGFELTGLPFLVALKPPVGASSMEEALPEGFSERVKERGVVYEGWVQQLQILSHKSVGCFVNHCGPSTMWEFLMSDCQIVLAPHLGDQILNTRLLADELKVAVEVERDANGWFSKEGLCKAVKSVMDKDSKTGSMVRKNHDKWREILAREGFMSSYIDEFIQKLYELF